ncbi:hypothetical protein [Streptomyces sp. NPDC050988]|uniref:hypothetical protein n=1 Tax=Streptomyces sp. NPDC050988 TaxID=3365637 RepID=UPI00378A55E6
MAELERAAIVFERATRSGIASDRANARVVRRSVQVIWKARRGVEQSTPGAQCNALLLRPT